MCMNRMPYSFSRGVTIIELVVSMVIITIAVAGVMALFLGTSRTSADPMVRAQSLAIAQSYMDEIMMQAYTPVASASGRSNYNDVDDYNAITAGSSIEDQFGNLIDIDMDGLDDLPGYTVEVTIALCTNVICVSDLTNQGAKKITIVVSHAGLGTDIPIIAYRTNY